MITVSSISTLAEKEAISLMQFKAGAFNVPMLTHGGLPSGAARKL